MTRPATVSSVPAIPSGARAHLSVLRLPGVYPPQRDTWLLADVLVAEMRAREGTAPRVLELGCGAGALAAVAARAGAAEITAVDVSRRALLCTWLNVRARGGRVRTRHRDLGDAVGHGRFDLVVANPPYVPAPTDGPTANGILRAYDGGRSGRLLVDLVCAHARALLRPGGQLLMVHSAFNGVAETLDRAAACGLDADVVARVRQPFGPVLDARAAMMEQRSLIRPGERTEELVVVRARRPGASTAVAA